jgi:hypothetical protein
MTLTTKQIDALVSLIEYHQNEGWYEVIEITGLLAYESGKLRKELLKMRGEV